MGMHNLGKAETDRQFVAKLMVGSPEVAHYK